MNNFIKAIEFTLPWETGRDRSGKLRQDGGLNDDDGSWTKWGIRQAANPDLDVPNLTIDDAFKIYKTRYYDSYKAFKSQPLDLDTVDQPYAVAVFDTGVNCGINRCYNWHLTATKTKDPVKTLLGLRDMHYTNLKAGNFTKYGKQYNGWINRLNDLKKYCAILAADGTPQVASKD
jgi:lysozyme family protein